MENRNDNSKPIIFSPWLERAYKNTDKAILEKELAIARGTFVRRFEFLKSKEKIAGLAFIMLPLMGAAMLFAESGAPWMLTNGNEALSQGFYSPCFSPSETDAGIVMKCYADLQNWLLWIIGMLVFNGILAVLIFRKYELRKKST